MKNPQVLFPFLYASSWFGNLLLTALAVSLALTHDGPLTPVVFIAMAVCIFSGNLLPGSVYLLQLRWYQAQQRGEAAQADLLLRESLRRSEEVLARLDEAEGAVAKSLMLARQVPDQLARKADVLESLLAKVGEEDWATASQHLELHARDLDFLKDESAAIQQKLAAMQASIAALRTDELIAKIDSMAAGISSTPAKAKVRKANSQPSPQLDLLLEPEPSGDADYEESMPAASLRGQESPRSVSSGEEDHDMPAAPLRGQESPRSVSSGDGEAMPALEEEAEPVARPGPCTLRVQAMIGISNRLYVRGEIGDLSLERGKEMKLVGIGEYLWEFPEVDSPVSVHLYLNDAKPALDGPVTLKPGEPVRILNPRFG